MSEPTPEPVAPPAPSSPGRTTAGHPEGDTTTDRALVLLRTLEKVLPELESARRELAEYQERAEARIRQLETERDLDRAEVVGAREQRLQAEARANMLGKSAELLERRLSEESETLQKQIQQLMVARDHLHAERAQLESRVWELKKELEVGRQQLHDERETHVRQVMTDLGERRTGITRVRKVLIESRVRVLETLVQTVQRELREQKQEADARIRQLEAERDENAAQRIEVESHAHALQDELTSIKRQLLEKKQEGESKILKLEAIREELRAKLEAREKDLSNLRQGSDEALGKAQQEAMQALTKVHELESALQKTRERFHETELEVEKQKALVESLRTGMATAGASATSEVRETPPAPAAKKKEAFLSPGTAAKLYEQSATRLTVVLASAELLLMSPRVDPSVKELAQDIKSQGKELMEVIKSYTLPPPPRPPQEDGTSD